MSLLLLALGIFMSLSCCRLSKNLVESLVHWLQGQMSETPLFPIEEYIQSRRFSSTFLLNCLTSTFLPPLFEASAFVAPFFSLFFFIILLNHFIGMLFCLSSAAAAASSSSSCAFLACSSSIFLEHSFSLNFFLLVFFLSLQSFFYRE